ncbi:hypothetical protein PRIPAC_75756 [Pristionchus pacificus]|uniref:Uncharacterized protein n=1 Tax=Pristionchus pacificus TaxID=54126 RepID=A0A2A6CA75_PRIPA|nr:hypothetical protein PRIPAC_75756 [Pristionchus pacificus]|eukprot:PDM74996.1 hypothetical protein PRIPAC_40377 [Pristionchus pacificus]
MCTFSLDIPKASVTFVDVPLLELEIDRLNGNMTDLKINGGFVANSTDEFQNDFKEISDEAISELNEMFELSSELKKSSDNLLKQSGKKKNEAQSLSDVLKCMVNGGLPEKCYTPPIDLPSTETPSTTTIEGSGHEGSGEEGSGEGSGEEGSGKGNEGGGLVIIDGDIDLMSDMLLT